jgi:hypothetical protein
VRGAAAGAVSAAIWAASEPVFQRAFGTPYSDAQLLSSRRSVGLVLHTCNGAVFGAVFSRLGGRGVKQGVAAALVENTALWPAMLVVDRVHPKVRSGEWPTLATNGRVFAQSSAAHALFGAVLGRLCR